MADATDEFFRRMTRYGYDRCMTIADGSVRFSIRQDGHTDHWLLYINDGRITVSHQPTGGDAVVHADRAVFNRIASGEAYFLTTVMRGDAAVEGSPRLLAMVRRLFPAPPDATGSAASSCDRGGGHA